jgi:nitrogenase molybdenum-iron protein alpha/beta subunit/MoaA/NifB/PqqE/SkfB family radical SAM enzyme
LAVSDACNNSCVFCLNGRIDGRIPGVPVHPPTLDEIRANLEEGYGLGLREAAFTIAEPTMGRHLVAAVRMARDMGFELVSMNTNGRLLHRGSLLEDLLNAGMGRIVLSIHGDRAEDHDAIVQRPGAFDEVVEGLKKLARIRPASGFRLEFLVVMTRRNVARIAEIYQFFLAHASPKLGDGICCSAMKPLGSALATRDDLELGYGDLMDAWLHAWRSLGAPVSLRLCEVPGCVVLSRSADGGPVPSVDVPDHRFVRDRGQTNVVGSPDPYYAKRPACRECKLEPVCSGVQVTYIERFGWDEFLPVKSLPMDSAPKPASVSASLPPETVATSLLAWLLDSPLEMLARAGIHGISAGSAAGKLSLTMLDSGGRTTILEISPRDDSRPSYLRTVHLNLSHGAGTVEAPALKVIARLARTRMNTKFEEIEAAWDRLSAQPTPQSAPSPAIALPAVDDSAALPDDMPLEDAFGDTACGMMGALDVLQELPAEFAILVHGDRGCLPAFEQSSGNIFSSDMREMDVIDGGERRLHEAARGAIDIRPSSRALVIVGTCLSEMIGDDLEQVATELEQDLGVPVVAIQANGLRPLRPIEVARRVHGALASRFLRSAGQPANQVSFVGYPDDAGRFEQEVQAILSEAGISVGAFWPSGGLEALSSIASSRLVMAPERVVFSSFLEAVGSLTSAEVVDQATPFAVGSVHSFFLEIGRRMGRETEMALLLEPRLRRLNERISAFKARHQGRRVAVSFGNNRKGTGSMTTVHLGVGYVPFLLELGLKPVLVALTEESTQQLNRVRALATFLGASPEVYLHRRPEGLESILRSGNFDLATNESCQKHFIDAAGVTYFHFMRFEPGFSGIERTLMALEGVMA